MSHNSFLPTVYLGSSLFLQMDEGTALQLRTQKVPAVELDDPPPSAPARAAEGDTESYLHMHTHIPAHHTSVKSKATTQPVLP